MTTPIGTFTVRDEPTIRDAWLRTVYNMFVINGYPAPNILPGSELYIRATAFARQLTVVESNGTIAVNNQMPDSATGDAFARWMSILGLSQRGNGGSAGLVTISCSQTTTIIAGTQLVDSAGLLYQVTNSSSYSNNQQVPIKAVSGGISTNHTNGDVLKWVVPPPFCSPTVVVGIPGGGDGLVGGVDVETVETARSRMMLRFQNPMGGGNWTTFSLLAAQASPLVQQAFVYPAANGPGTVHVAVVGYASSLAASNARNRDIASSVMTGAILPFMTGNVAEYAEVVVTTVANQPVDIALGLNLPASPAASPPGPGGGWLDAQPWPYNSTGASTFKCTATSVASSTVFTVDAPTAPVPGVSRIAWIDPSTWQLNTATVTSFTGSTGAYTLTIDTPWPNLATSFVTYGGAYVFPQSVNQDTYVAAALSAFASMGPGEKTDAAGLLSRAARKPLPTTLFPYSLGNQFLQVVTDSDNLIAATSWLYRSAASPYVPDLPALIGDPPKIFVPRNIGFYST